MCAQDHLIGVVLFEIGKVTLPSSLEAGKCAFELAQYAVGVCCDVTGQRIRARVMLAEVISVQGPDLLVILNERDFRVAFV